MRRGFATILILGLVVAAFALGGAFYVKQRPSPTPPINNQPTIKSSPQASPSPLSSPADTSNWKTYTNNEFNFEFKYPKEISLNVDTNVNRETKLTLSLNNPKPYADISLEVTTKTEQTILTEIGEKLGKSTLALNGMQANKYFGQSGVAGTLYRERIFIIHGNLTYHFNLGTYDQREILDQILSTFKFTN